MKISDLEKICKKINCYHYLHEDGCDSFKKTEKEIVDLGFHCCWYNSVLGLSHCTTFSEKKIKKPAIDNFVVFLQKKFFDDELKKYIYVMNEVGTIINRTDVPI